MNRRSATCEPCGEGTEFGRDLVEARLVPVDEVHLVHGDDDVADPEQRGDEEMAPRLLEHAVAGVQQHDAQVRGGRARDHVAGVRHVPRGVRDDERPARRREVAVRDVDRDALLALRAQPVGDEREIDAAVLAVPTPARAPQRVELIVRERARVVQQSPDQRRLAVVDGPRRHDTQELAAAQKYPSRLRSSIAASVTRSSARVSPRSVIRLTAISATTAASERAPERMAPVQVMSPTVR